MTGPVNPDSYDLADTLRMRLAETAPRTSSHVETELQQLAARRLDNASAAVRKRRSLRGLPQRKETTTGRVRLSAGLRLHRGRVGLWDARRASPGEGARRCRPSMARRDRSAPGPPGAARARRAIGAHAPNPCSSRRVRSAARPTGERVARGERVAGHQCVLLLEPDRARSVGVARRVHDARTTRDIQHLAVVERELVDRHDLQALGDAPGRTTCGTPPAATGIARCWTGSSALCRYAPSLRPRDGSAPSPTLRSAPARRIRCDRCAHA